MSIRIETKAADNIRILSASMVEKAKSGHPGGAMGGADFINILYSEFLNYDPSDLKWPNRDRFFLDPGHMSPMLYSILALSGYYSMDDLLNFRQWGSVTPGHPERDLDRRKLSFCGLPTRSFQDDKPQDDKLVDQFPSSIEPLPISSS